MIDLAGIPVLETSRLVLRGPKAADASAYMDFFASERAQYVGGHTTRRKAFDAFTLEVGHWLVRGYGMWAVTMRGEDTALGYVGCWYPEGWNAREIGWVLFEAAEGKGVAFEAAEAARTYAYGTLGWTTAISNIDPENARSIRLAQRLGCTLDADAKTIDTGDLVYRHPAPEALQ